MTKEDIEREGWRFMAKSWDDWYEKEGEWDMRTWIGRKAVMQYGIDERLRIFIDDFGTEHTVFQGNCPNIETFRIINKLVLNEYTS